MTALALSTSNSTLPKRLNARLDATAAQRLSYLMTRTGLAMSDVVRLSLESLYNATRQQSASTSKKSSLDALIGRYGSDASLNGRVSTTYKDLLAQGLANKHSSQANGVAQK